jgi:hypothetical protein
MLNLAALKRRSGICYNSIDNSARCMQLRLPVRDSSAFFNAS